MADGGGDPKEDDILSILIATDCHLGYGEKDPIRHNDSFVTFEEILQIAQQKKVDMILLGGDLFHENKPSRKTVHRTISLLRRYCLGNKECQLEFLSDQSVDFGHCDFPVVNYEDPNYNIAYPVFSIHGNHDDPTGEGSLSAIDILSTAGLLNHFGKAASCDNIEMSPVLLKKGSTKLALFGLGAMRDERLHKTFCAKKVKMLRPKEDPDSWFNIFVIHQNRAKHGPKNYIPESFLDEFLDLVVWGHEHECLIDPTWSESSKPFYITQPGSSVATSLSEGESKQKHVGLLHIHHKSFKMTKIPLKTVRQFMADDVSLEESGLDPGQDEQVHSFLTEKVEQMISSAEETHSGHEKQPLLPLIRIRVEYSGGFQIINPHRFGQQFVKRVANNKDILLFYRKRAQQFVDKKDRKDGEEPELHFSQPNSVKMEDLINEYLNAVDDSLQLNVLSERKLSKALNEFVLKEEKDAISELVKYQLRKTQSELSRRNLQEDSIAEEILRVKSDDEKVDEAAENEEIEKVMADARSRSIDHGSSMNGNDNMMDDDDDFPTDDMPVKGRGRGRARATGRGSRGGRGNRGGKAASTPKESTRGKGRGRGAKSQQKTLQDTFMSAKASTSAQYISDDEMADLDESFPMNTSRRTQNRQSSARPSSTRYHQSIELSDEDDDHDPFSMPASKRSRR